MDPSSNLHFFIFHGHFLVASYIIIISLCLTFDERSSFHGSLDKADVDELWHTFESPPHRL